MMKLKQQLLMAALCILLALLLIGCGSTPAPTAAPSPSPAESVPSATLPDAGLKPDDGGESQPEVNEQLELAKSFVDKPLADLVAQFGEPLSSSYASSCLGPGEDGELTFDGFTVITYREGDTETVTYVEAAG